MLSDVLKPATQEIIDERLSKLSPVKQLLTSVQYSFDDNSENLRKLQDLKKERGTSFLANFVHTIRKRLKLNVHYKIEYSEQNSSYFIKIFNKPLWQSNIHMEREEELLVIFASRYRRRIRII